jgi:hypothetical protein
VVACSQVMFEYSTAPAKLSHGCLCSFLGHDFLCLPGRRKRRRDPELAQAFLIIKRPFELLTESRSPSLRHLQPGGGPGQLYYVYHPIVLSLPYFGRNTATKTCLTKCNPCLTKGKTQLALHLERSSLPAGALVGFPKWLHKHIKLRR